MSLPLERYGLVGDSETVALVADDGAIDWLCMPRFDSGACFAALLGDDENGRWRIAPAGEVTRTRRRYRPGTLILETELTSADGTIRLIDFMPPRGTGSGRGHLPDLVRIVEGVEGRVPVRMDLRVRFDYGWIVPWVTHRDDLTRFVAGPDALVLATPVEPRGEDHRTTAEFTVGEGDQVPFVLTWHPSHQAPPETVDPFDTLDQTTRWWREWTERSTYNGKWADAVQRSLITLKALTYAPTGAIVAAPTTSLPERLGGERNWDYRYTWLRDATFTLYALTSAGYRDEAEAWRDWLLRTVAGDPSKVQILYGIAGERRLPELELPWLTGYEDSRPVRVGNAAHGQLQLDVYGEVMDAMHHARRAGLHPDEPAWDLQRVLLDHLESHWHEPDNGIWEVRGDLQHFTHSRVMAWVAFDRAVKAVEQTGLDGPVDRWKRLRDEVHDEVCREGYDAELGAFTQAYDSKALDASLLLIPQVGFLPPDDERVVSTIDAIDRTLSVGDGFVLRYDVGESDDGLGEGEGAFLLCSFWMVDALAQIGRRREAEERFERLLGLRNDVGLLAEEYDTAAGRLIGNFPQAFSHIGLVNSAANLSVAEGGPMEQRSERREAPNP